MRILFIDRDGTLIHDPTDNYLVDSFGKLRFLPKAISGMARVARETDFILTMVTNQDGLGREEFPEALFWPPHNFVMRTFEDEGVRFRSVHIDRTYPHENAPTRKPGTGMLTEYLDGSYDIANSFVIGDRITDVLLAKNLGCKAIWMNDGSGLGGGEIGGETPESLRPYVALESADWLVIADFLCSAKP